MMFTFDTMLLGRIKFIPLQLSIEMVSHSSSHNNVQPVDLEMSIELTEEINDNLSEDEE